MVHMTKRFGPSLFHSGGQGWNQIGIWFAFHSLFLIPRHWGENICIHHMVWTACPFWVISPKGGYNVHLGGMKFPPTICRWPTLPYPASWNDKFTDNINHTPWNCIRNSQVCIHMFRNIYIYTHAQHPQIHTCMETWMCETSKFPTWHWNVKHWFCVSVFFGPPFNKGFKVLFINSY